MGTITAYHQRGCQSEAEIFEICTLRIQVERVRDLAPGGSQIEWDWWRWTSQNAGDQKTEMEKLKGKMSQELSKIEERTGKIDDELQEVQARTRTKDLFLLFIYKLYIFDMYSCV